MTKLAEQAATPNVPSRAELAALLLHAKSLVFILHRTGAPTEAEKAAARAFEKMAEKTARALALDDAIPIITTHGLNRDCPNVQSGEWDRCRGHGHNLPNPQNEGVAAHALSSFDEEQMIERAADAACYEEAGIAAVNDREAFVRLRKADYRDWNHRKQIARAALRAAGVIA